MVRTKLLTLSAAATSSSKFGHVGRSRGKYFEALTISLPTYPCNSNERTLETRGGAFKTEHGSGTVNIVKSNFEKNYASTDGAAIYSRANQLNIIESRFLENVSLGWVRKVKREDQLQLETV